MLDKERVLGKIDELNKYLAELHSVIPVNFPAYQEIEKKRSCERLLQLGIECVIDICKLFVVGLKLGLPSEENDLFDKLFKRKIISKNMLLKLKEMRGFRNILVHEYTVVDDELVFKALKTKLEDFRRFKEEAMKALGGRENA